MSQDDTISRKDKKALRDAERHKKGKKRKHADTEEEQGAAQDAIVKEEAPAKKARKREEEDSLDRGDKEIESKDTVSDKPKPKKHKKARTDKTEDGEDTHESEKPAKSRFIVFVGNLPYKTTDDSLKLHFKKLQPFTLRHRTDPKTKKSKGFAFLEFENYDRMKTCLKLYHHSMFDPEDVKEDGADLNAEADVREEGNRRKKKSQARRINVELTAGGGGKTDARKEKIKAKNDKLEEERKRRAEAERKEKEKKARKEQKKGGSGNGKKDEPEEAANAGADASHGIHPSRLARMNV